MLVLADAENQRALSARADEQIRMLGAHCDKGEVTAEPLHSPLHGRHQITLVVVCDQMGDHLGIRLGSELRAEEAQLLAQVKVVLDDAVEHDVHAAVGVGVGMRVLPGDRPMRRPPCMADAGGRLAQRGRRAAGSLAGTHRQGLSQRGQVPDGANRLDAPVLLKGQARGVIATILKALKTSEQDLLAGPTADIPDDPAHGG